MYKLKVSDAVYTIPKTNIVAFALYQALSRGIAHGPIHDTTSAINYLNSIGVEVDEND